MSDHLHDIDLPRSGGEDSRSDAGYSTGDDDAGHDNDIEFNVDAQSEVNGGSQHVDGPRHVPQPQSSMQMDAQQVVGMFQALLAGMHGGANASNYAQPFGSSSSNSSSSAASGRGRARNPRDVSPQRRGGRDGSGRRGRDDRSRDTDDEDEGKRSLIHTAQDDIKTMKYVNVSVYLLSNASVTRESELKVYQSPLQYVQCMGRYMHEIAMAHYNEPKLVSMVTAYWQRISTILASTSNWSTVVRMDAYIRERENRKRMRARWVVNQDEDEHVREFMDAIRRTPPITSVRTGSTSNSSSTIVPAKSSASSSGSRRQLRKYCYRFNGEDPVSKILSSTNHCSSVPCKFPHVCSSCGEAHARYQVPECASKPFVRSSPSGNSTI